MTRHFFLSLLRFLGIVIAFGIAMIASHSDKPLDAFFSNPAPSARKLDLVAVLQMIKGDSVTLVDLRDPEEYMQGRIGEALNVPSNSSLEFAATVLLNRDLEKPIIAYHVNENGPLYRGLALLQKLDFSGNIYLYTPGWAEWKQTGLDNHWSL